MMIFSYLSALIYVVGTQKNCLNDTVLFSSQNIWFSQEIRKNISELPPYLESRESY